MLGTRSWKALSLLLALTSCAAVAAEPANRPKLVVWITVDQLRGDMPWRYLPPSATEGFRYLAKHGTFCSDARYRHGLTFTAVGHATLFTGGYVGQHGIAGNEWYDSATRENVPAIGDDRHPLIGKKPAKEEGCSPVNLQSSTIGDEMILASGGRSRVFSVSAKDRGAILPGGHMGKAFWYSSSTGQYVTSSYYYKEYPEWVKAWNDAKPADRYLQQVWTLKDDKATYLHAGDDDRPCEKGYKQFKRVFPHALAADKPADVYSAITYTPFSDELTMQFAKEVLAQEKLGQGEATDLLAISLSATDQIGHMWGPESLEAEDNVRRIDALLAGFFKHLDQVVGLNRTLIVLSADHGMDEIPECAAARGVPAGRHDPKKFLKVLNDGLKARFKIDKDLAIVFWSPSIYFDLEAVRSLNLDLPTVERAAAEEMMRMPGMAYAVARTEMLAGKVLRDPLGEAVALSFHPRRSGNVLIFNEPFWYLYHDATKYAAIHGSPYAYDQYVPLLVAGPGIPRQIIHRTVGPEQMAPTVASYLGIKRPSGCVTQVIPEMLEAGARSPGLPGAANP